MKWESLENKIKSALYGHKSEVDVDALWSAIESDVDAINRKKKRRGFIWFWFLGTLMAGAGAAYCFHQNNDLGNEGVKNTGYVHHENFGKNIQEKEIGVEQNNKNASGDELAEVLVKKAVSKFEKTNSANANPVSKSNVFYHELPKTKNQTISKSANQHLVISENNVEQKNGDPKGFLAGGFPAQTENSGVSNLFYAGEKVMNVSAIPTLALGFFDVHPAAISIKEPFATESDLLPTLRRKNWDATMNLQSSLSFVQRDLVLKDSFSDNLLNSRKKSERELEAYQIGLGFTLQHRSGLNFSTGLNYTQINEQFRFNDMVVKVDTVYDVKYLAINLNNDTVQIYGEVPFETKTTYQKEYYNKYRMVDVPLLVGYRHVGHEFSFGAQAGVFVNLSLVTKGQFLKSPTETMDIDTAGIFKSNIGWSYYFGLTAGYLINDNLELYASPFMRHFPKDFTKDNYAIRQRYNLYGVNFGLRYMF